MADTQDLPPSSFTIVMMNDDLTLIEFTGKDNGKCAAARKLVIIRRNTKETMSALPEVGSVTRIQ